jgi:toxin ParE1/3/4
MVKLTYHPEAKFEITEAATYYEGCRDGLGRAFLETVEQGANSILAEPERWRRITGPWRRYLLNRFPYGIIYRVNEGAVFVAAVMHLHRKPGYWKDRVD